MPLEATAKGYADKIFSNSTDEIVHGIQSEIVAAKNDFGQRNMLKSGMFFSAYADILVKQIRLLGQARTHSLLKAFEMAGIPFDDAAFHETKQEAMQYCHGAQHNAIGHISNLIHQEFGFQGVPANFHKSISSKIENGVTGVMARLVRDLSIKRDETVLETHRTADHKLTHESRIVTRSSVNAASPSSADSEDRTFASMAIEEARKSIHEDGRPHPLVGAVVVKNGVVLSKAHRGEKLKSHAEFTALEDKLSDDSIAGATVYTTLEPCTTRKHPKIPCAQRLIDRKVSRVVIGMLDPNPDIRGLGDQLLNEAGIETQLFPRELRMQVEELNREFMRDQKQRQSSGKPRENTAATIAARLLSDATWHLQRAAWSFHALHTQYGVARAASDIANDEKAIMAKLETAITVFNQDYDLPTILSAEAKEELGKINIALANMMAFSMTGQAVDMKTAVTQIQDSCERIRFAAKPFAYRSTDSDSAEQYATVGKNYSPNVPNMMLEWDSSTQPWSKDRVRLKNISPGSLAIQVRVGEFSWPEIRWHRPIEIQSVDGGKEESREAQFTVTLESGHEIGYMVRALEKFEGREPLQLEVSFSDIDSNVFSRVFKLTMNGARSSVLVTPGPFKRHTST